MENEKIKRSHLSDAIGVVLILIGIVVAFSPLFLALTVDPDAFFFIFNTFSVGLLFMMSGVLIMVIASYLRGRKEKR